MGNTPRLEPTTAADWDERTAALMDATGGLNIFATLAHHPDLLRRWMVFGAHVLAKSTLPERERELVVLRTGWRCGSEYEFGQHTVIGHRAGLGDDEIRRIASDTTEGWSAPDSALLAAVDELVADHRIADDTWASLSGTWDTQQLIDLVFTVGQYALVSSALNSFGVELDEGVPGWPS